MTDARCNTCREPMPAGARFCPLCGAPWSTLGSLGVGSLLDARYRVLARLGEGASV